MALFIALPLPGSIRSLLKAIKLDVAGARPEHPDDLHITVQHSIQSEGATTARLIAALNDIKAEPFSLEPMGLSFFAKRETGAPTIIYLAIKPNDQLIALRRAVETMCANLGFAANNAQYTPHITLCRLSEDAERGAVNDVCNTPPAVAIPSWPATRFGLYEATKNRTPGFAPRYSTVAEFQMTP